MAGRYQNKRIWIIGASSGIGEALAQKLADEGAVLALSARSESKLAVLRHKLGEAHKVIPLDVADTQAVAQATQGVKQVLGGIDSVIFLAALYEPQFLDKLDINQTRKIIDVNLGGAFNVVDAVLPVLKAQKSGQIALCGSVAGYAGLPKGQPYSATKAGVINLAESLRAEAGRYGIDVKVINPGFVKTPLTDKNDFDMPMITTPEKAAAAIADGLQKSGFEIHFPKKFTFMVKFLAAMPYGLYFWLVKKIRF